MSPRFRLLGAALLGLSCGRPAPAVEAPEGIIDESFHNPILPGFHPDPSVCRVGDDYYLATSSFEYFPGVPIFHSRDLVSWRQIGHALTRETQLPLAGAKSSQGIFAPTLRHHDGTFYLITTNISGGGNFYVTSRDPAGEWSEPVWLAEREWGMDPSLFFDDDGKVYYTRHGGGERGAIYQAELDLARGALLEDARPIWSGTGGVWPEGPHLYKHGGHYYLLISEGGTSYEHMLTVARAGSPWGPFEPHSGNPILTHRERRDLPIQATGHGDLVTTPHGAWWLVFLGIRPWDGKHHHLGRETFLAPVSWSGAHWPVINHGRPIALEMDRAGLPPARPWTAPPARDEFDDLRLGLAWNFVRNPAPTSWSLAERPGWLRLRGQRASLSDVASPAFVGRRQTAYRAHASTWLDFRAQRTGQEAGLAVRADEKNHFTLGVVAAGDRRVARLSTRIRGEAAQVAELELQPGPVVLSVEAHPAHYEFFVAQPGGAARSLGRAPTEPLSSEATGGFTGVYLGMYAVAADGEAPPPADFDWFEYRAEG